MVSIVQATKADLKCIYNVETEAFGSHGYPAFFIRQAFDCWANGLLVAKNEDQIFGYVLQVPSSNHQGDLVVDKSVQSMEGGKYLILVTKEEVTPDCKIDFVSGSTNRRLLP